VLTSHHHIDNVCSINVRVGRIMAKYVGDIAGRVSTDMSGACPFARSLQQEHRSLYEVMQGDKRITTDLLENFIMAVFRTGVDSVGSSLVQHNIVCRLSLYYYSKVKLRRTNYYYSTSQSLILAITDRKRAGFLSVQLGQQSGEAGSRTLRNRRRFIWRRCSNSRQTR
jgi:hypothetical protein